MVSALRARLRAALRRLPPRRALRNRRRFRQWAEAEILADSSYRAAFAQTGAAVHRIGVWLIRFARRFVRFMNHHTTDEESDHYVMDRGRLHARIREILERQRDEYQHLPYFYGQPYQALAMLDVYGERATEERFDAYGLDELISAEDRVLDVGCSCGFMGLYTSFRTGCTVDGIDVNPHLIDIGRACVEHLGLEDRVNLRPCRTQDFEPSEPYSVVFSFATHWTDDENYRVGLRDHFKRLHSWLRDGGLLVFESHSNDLGDDDFERAVQGIRTHFELLRRQPSDGHTRELLVFRKRPETRPELAPPFEERQPDVVGYAGSWVDEQWLRSTLARCAEQGMRVQLAVSAGWEDAPDGVIRRYFDGPVELLAGLDRQGLSRLTGRLLLSSTTNIGELPLDGFPTRAYMPHSLTSLHVSYPPDAFDGYDALFAGGPHQAAELAALDASRNLKGRRSYETGYGKLDLLRDQAEGRPDREAEPRHVLIAPSWGERSVLEAIGASLCGLLLEAGHSVTLRPHPMQLRLAEDVIATIARQRGEDDRFRLESPLGPDDSIFSADVLVTDFSGIAMEFAALDPRPIVFVDVPLKVLNPAWESLGLEPMEVVLRDQLGVVVPAEAEAVASAVSRPQWDAESQRNALARVLYDGDESCAERAASAIAELVGGEPEPSGDGRPVEATPIRDYLSRR